MGSHSQKRNISLWMGLVACALWIGPTAGCKEGKPDYVGFGKYEIGKSTPADGYACHPDKELTVCIKNPSPKIAGQATQTDLYFRGHDEKSSPLVEIFVGIWGCKIGPVKDELFAKIGKPTESAGGGRFLWRLKKMDVVALLPRDPDMCSVHFLDKNEGKRLAQLYPASSADSK